MSPANFQYKPRGDDEWKKREQQSSSKFAGFISDAYKTFSPKKANWIRILPPTWDNPAHYGMDLWVHYSVGPDNGSVICLYKMGKGPCPICEAHARAEAQGREDAGKLKPTRRVVVWLIDRNEEKNAKEALVWAMPWTVDRDISKICRDRMSGELFQIDNPEEGYDVTFDVEGERPNIKYVGFQIARRPSPVDASYLNKILTDPIPNTFQWRTYDEVQALFEGVAPTATPAAGSAAPTATAPVANYVPPPVTAAPPQAPAPVAPFVSEWTQTQCSVCGEGQYTTPNSITCKNGHEGADPLMEVAEPEPTPVAATPTAPPAAAPIAARPTTPSAPPEAPTTPARGSSTAAALRARFQK